MGQRQIHPFYATSRWREEDPLSTEVLESDALMTLSTGCAPCLRNQALAGWLTEFESVDGMLFELAAERASE